MSTTASRAIYYAKAKLKKKRKKKEDLFEAYYDPKAAGCPVHGCKFSGCKSSGQNNGSSSQRPCVQFQMNAAISLSFYYKILFVTVNIKFVGGIL